MRLLRAGCRGHRGRAEGCRFAVKPTSTYIMYLSTRPEAFPGARQSPDWPSQPFSACAWASRPFNVPLAAPLPSGVMRWQFDSSSRRVETDGRQGTVFRTDSMRAEQIHHWALWKDFRGLQEGRTKGKQYMPLSFFSFAIPCHAWSRHVRKSNRVANPTTITYNPQLHPLIFQVDWTYLHPSYSPTKSWKISDITQFHRQRG